MNTTPGSVDPSPPANPFPQAILLSRESRSWWWVVPWVAVAVVLLLLIQAWWQQPLSITIRFREGHGLKAGDPIRFRGIAVGEVQRVGLTSDRAGIEVAAGLDPACRKLAARGTRFWIVRPQAGIQGIQGLDTLIGPRYLALAPGSGSSQVEFDGLEEAPVLVDPPPGGLELVLEAAQRGGLRPGVPVLYRQVPVGTVLSVGLANDALNLEVRVWIAPRFKPLIRERARFWNAGGIEVNLGLLAGLSIDMESLQSLWSGGISLAVPEDSGAPVLDGQRFPLADRPEREWLT